MVKEYGAEKMADSIVIIGANDFQNQLILKAKQLGYQTHVFAWQCGDIGEKTADYFYPISIIEKEKILEECKKIQPKGIVSIASDLANITVNYVAEKLGLTGNGMHCTRMATNKHLMRRAFEANHLPSPKSILISLDNIEDVSEFQYPLIVKPTDRSGSRGIFKVENVDQLQAAISKVQELSFEHKALVEEFVEGNEYSIEYVSWKGTHTFLAVTKKQTTGAPYFIETGHVQPADDISLEMQETLKILVPQILDALEIRYGASHTELKIDQNGKIGIIEVGARMGGDCIGSDLVFISTGYDFVKMVIDIACGIQPQFIAEKEKQIAAVQFIFDEEDSKKLDWIYANHAEAIYRISEMEPFDERTISDSSTRYGYYLLATDDKDKMNEILE